MLELQRDQLPAGLDLGHRFLWEGATYQVKSLGGSWVTAQRVTEPAQKPAVPPAIPAPKEVAPAAPAEPAAQEAAAPIVEQAPEKPVTAPLAEAINGYWAIVRPASEAEALRVLIEVGLEQWRLAQKAEPARSRRRMTRWARVKVG
jgi:hypothetical protein